MKPTNAIGSERPRYFRGAFLTTVAFAAVIVLCDPAMHPPPGLSVGGFVGALTGSVVGYSAIPVLVGTVAGIVWVIFLKRPFAKIYLIVSMAVLLIPWTVNLPNLINKPSPKSVVDTPKPYLYAQIDDSNPAPYVHAQIDDSNPTWFARRDFNYDRIMDDLRTNPGVPYAVYVLKHGKWGMSADPALCAKEDAEAILAVAATEDAKAVLAAVIKMTNPVFASRDG
jgi:hypothetical protein